MSPNRLADEQRRKELRDAVKDGLKEWLNDQFGLFGKWTLRGLLAAALAGLVYLFFASHGWRNPIQ